jgi:RNA polymerase sigma-70 factor (ECF subfamily)
MLTEAEAHNISDNELIALSLKDPDNYAFLMRRFEKPLARYIRRITNAPQDTIDSILQDIFIKVYENLNDFDNSFPVSSWIFRITHNASIDHIRKSSRDALPESSLDTFKEDESEGRAFDRVSADIDIEGDLDKVRAHNMIKSVLLSLPEKYRTILALYYFEDKSYIEISDILKKPIGTVGTLIRRAKDAFRKKALDQNVPIHEL